MKRSAMSWLVAGGLALAVVARVPPARATDPRSPGSMDREFLTEAASGGMMEVELGRYAAEHGESERVKQFGRRMADDHAKANAELKQVAAKSSVTVPTTMNAEDREKVARLTNLHEDEFDRAYMSWMVTDHQKDVRKFRTEADSAQDQDVKSFAAKTLPTLESHLQMAQEIQSDMGQATSGARY